MQNKNRRKDGLYFGGRAGTRTLDPLIKSQLLYQLSYAPDGSFIPNTRELYIFLSYLQEIIISFYFVPFPRPKARRARESLPMQSFKMLC